MIGVTGLVSSVAESGECSVAPDVLSKADGFFQVKARAGQRWHFHLDAAPGQNLSVFTASSCDLRECVAAADVCGVNESEHFTFVAQRAADYVVVLDGIDPNAAPLRLLAISPECADGKKVHGEGCDDGNQQNGDGCDDACRVELKGLRRRGGTERRHLPRQRRHLGSQRAPAHQRQDRRRCLPARPLPDPSPQGGLAERESPRRCRWSLRGRAAHGSSALLRGPYTSFATT